MVTDFHSPWEHHPGRDYISPRPMPKLTLGQQEQVRKLNAWCKEAIKNHPINIVTATNIQSTGAGTVDFDFYPTSREQWETLFNLTQPKTDPSTLSLTMVKKRGSFDEQKTKSSYTFRPMADVIKPADSAT